MTLHGAGSLLPAAAHVSSRHCASAALEDAAPSRAAGEAGASTERQARRARGHRDDGDDDDDAVRQGCVLQIDAAPPHASRDDMLDAFAECGIPVQAEHVRPAYQQSNSGLLPRVRHWEATLATRQQRDRAVHSLASYRMVRPLLLLFGHMVRRAARHCWRNFRVL